MEREPLALRHPELMQAFRTGAEPVLEAVDDAVLAAVNRFALKPLTRDEIAVFQLDLCHNQVDRHFSRFPEEELEQINRLVVGAPLMERHDLQGSLPRGRFFRSRLHQEGERVSVRPEVYVLRTPENAAFIRNIEGGIFRETSIGFAFRRPECSICGEDMRGCEHIPGRRYGEDEAHYIMREVTDVLEGSIVAAGSQGTAFVQATERGFQAPDWQQRGAAWALE